MTEWVALCPLEDIPRLGARTLTTPRGNIGLFRTNDDRVFALADRCPHRGGPLSQGIVHGHFVTCPLHDWTIDLVTGKAKPPDEGCTKSYPVRIEQGTILIPREFVNVEAAEVP